MLNQSSITITELPTVRYAIPRHLARIELEGPGIRITMTAEGGTPELAYEEIKTKVAAVISTLYTLSNGYVEVTSRTLNQKIKDGD